MIVLRIKSAILISAFPKNDKRIMLIWAWFRYCIYYNLVVGNLFSGAFFIEYSLEHLRVHSKSRLEATVWVSDTRSEVGQGCLSSLQRQE